MINWLQETRPSRASHRHARCTCIHSTNLPPEQQDASHSLPVLPSLVDPLSPELAVVLIPPVRSLSGDSNQNTYLSA